MSDNELVIQLLDRLKNEKGKEDIDAALTSIEDLTQNGINEPLITILLGEILQTRHTIPYRAKLYLVENCLRPNEELSFGIFLKIISGIGVTRVYFKGTRKYKTKRLGVDLQLDLVNWIIDNFKHFQKSLIESGTLVLSILIKNLEYEFSRSPISQLMVLLLGQKTPPSTKFTTFYNREVYHRITILKEHHIQKVVDLYNKFPLDIYLSELLALFKVVVPDLDYITYSPDNYPMLNKLISNLDRVYLWEGSYSSFPLSFKRQKRVVGVINEDETSIIQSLDQIKQVNAYKLLRNAFNNDQDAQLLIILLQADNISFSNKIDNYVKSNLKVHLHEEVERIAFIKNLAHIYEISDGTIHFNSLEDFILKNHMLENYFFTEMGYRSLVIKYLVNVDPTNVTFMLARDTIDLKKLYYSNKNINTLSCSQYVDSIIYLLKVYISNNNLESTIQAINTIMPKLFSFINYCKPDQEWCTCKVLRFIQSLDADILQNLNDNVLLPPRTLVYSCLLSYDPLVLSTICAHIVFCKDHSYQDSKWRNLQNSYIMDSVNILWKERFLKQGTNIDVNSSSTTSSTRGLYLNSGLTRKLSSLLLLDQVGTSFQSIGEFFYNPALSYIITKIIWSIEDEKTDTINIRHQGPVSRDSLENIRNDLEKIWLNVSYEELKIKILQNMDQQKQYVKLQGIADLLFNCLKSLSDKRQS